MRLTFFFFAIAVVGCSGTSSGIDLTGSSSGSQATTPADAASLYDTPSGTATPGQLFGLWGGQTSADGTIFDLRVKLSATSFTMAARCTSGSSVSRIVSVTAAARNTQDDITVLESKQDADEGAVKCVASLAPGDTPSCLADGTNAGECFTLSGTTLVTYGGGATLTMVKLTDD